MIIDDILRDAVSQNASDMHASVSLPPIYRVNGDLKQSNFPVLTPGMIRDMALSILTDVRWEEFVENGEIDTSYSVEGVSRFRINIYKQRNSIAIAARVIPSEIPTIEQLDLPAVIRSFAGKSRGICLVTGPTGSGKSTTLAAMVHYINQTMKKHIITLEDPIEFLHTHKQCVIDQREIGIDTKNFYSGLRAALRQDPDVILVGEMRDLETIRTALSAAETGHLVLGTVHTSSAAGTIERIVDVFDGKEQGQVRLQLANSLVGVMTQQLLPTADGKGRVMASEILVNTPAVANLIRSDKVHQILNVMQTSRQLGMHTMQSSVQELLTKRLISGDIAAPYM